MPQSQGELVRFHPRISVHPLLILRGPMSANCPVVSVFRGSFCTLPLGPSEQKALEATSRAFHAMVNAIRAAGVRGNTASRLTLHYLNYARMRQMYPEEGSQLVSLAVHRAARLLKDDVSGEDGGLFDIDRNLAALLTPDAGRCLFSVRVQGGRIYLPVDPALLPESLGQAWARGVAPRIVTGTLFLDRHGFEEAVLRVEASWSSRTGASYSPDGPDSVLEVAA